MMLSFTKMHGLGNDFVVLDATREPLQLSPEQYRFIADRHFGIGCDQILRVEAPRSPDTEFYYRIINADGSEVQQCGNGARCFARFVQDRGLSLKDEIVVGTQAGVIRLQIQPDGQVCVNMGEPQLQPERIPFQAPQRANDYPISLNGTEYRIGAVSMGNPHAVMQVDDVDQTPVAELGPELEQHPRFPERVNAGFMQLLSASHIKLRVYERGTGETLACGTGACAAMVSGRLQGLLEARVRVSLPGGDLVLTWQGEGHPVWMTGPAATVYQGSIEL